MAAQRDFKGNSLLIATDNYVVVDLETTGVSPARDRIIEIGAVRVEQGTVTAEYSKLVNPGRPVGGFITGLTGISDEMVSSASPIDDVLPDFLGHLRPDDTIVAHNANFDINFLYDNCMRTLGKPFSHDFIDTLRMSRALFPQERQHRLVDLIQRFGIADEEEHRGLSDALQTVECYEHMKPMLANL